jgi:hypothetical protein
MEVFQNMWFTPIRERPSLDSAALLRKVMNITDVVAASRDMGLEWFEQLLLSVSICPQYIASIVTAKYWRMNGCSVSGKLVKLAEWFAVCSFLANQIFLLTPLLFTHLTTVAFGCFLGDINRNTSRNIGMNK